MPTRVIASFTSDVQQNCAWAISLHFLNADGSDHDLTPYQSLTGQVRETPAYDATPLANMTITVTSATGGIAVAALAAKDTKDLPATGQTFDQKSPAWAEIDGVLTADPLNPICLAHGLLQVAPGGNAQQSSGTAPTVPLETISLVVGAVSAAAARQLIGINDSSGKVPAAQLPIATAEAAGAVPHWPLLDADVPGLALPSKGDLPVGLGGGAGIGRVAAPPDGSILIADSTQPTGYSNLACNGTGNVLRATGVKGVVFAMIQPTRGTDDADGVGITITADAAGSGGAGNHIGGDIVLTPGPGTGTGRPGYVSIVGQGAVTKQALSVTGTSLFTGTVTIKGNGTNGILGLAAVVITTTGTSIGYGSAVYLDSRSMSSGRLWIVSSAGSQDVGNSTGRFIIQDAGPSGYGAAFEIAASTGLVKIPSLAGTGSRAVIADANGVLSAP